MNDFDNEELVVVERCECIAIDLKRIRREKFKYHLKEVLLELLPFAVVFLLFFIPALLLVNWAENEGFSMEVVTFMKISLGIVVASSIIGALFMRFFGGCDMGEFSDICEIIFGGFFAGVAVALIIAALIVVLGLLFLIVSAIVAVVSAIVMALVAIVSFALYIIPYILGIIFVIAIAAICLSIGTGDPDIILWIFEK